MIIATNKCFSFSFFHVYFSVSSDKLRPNTCSRARHYNRELVFCGSIVPIVWSSGLGRCAQEETTMHTVTRCTQAFRDAKTYAVHWYSVLYLLS